VSFWNIFSRKKKKTEESKEKSPFLPQIKDPIEILFAKNFTKKGGKFIFCETASELNNNFNNILDENKWTEKNIFCNNENLILKFGLSFNSFNLELNQSNVFFTTCEYLIANKGNILVSNNQLKNFKLNELPINLIVFSSINQIESDVSAGMTKLKNKYKNKVPSNITTLKPKKLIEENDFLSYGNSAKNIYLLLQDE
tara:strand:- start:4009 stop:4602 length:594 start_codon:yes stop_codon:yes gene_type:complete